MTFSPGKHDRKNVEFHEIPPEALWVLGKIASYGARKYGDNNWMGGLVWSRLYNSALRHQLAFWGGENMDRESGYPHLLHAASNLLMLYAHQARGIGTDDRVFLDASTFIATTIEKESNDIETLRPAR